jgi:hypothetical protein
MERKGCNPKPLHSQAVPGSIPGITFLAPGIEPFYCAPRPK